MVNSGWCKGPLTVAIDMGKACNTLFARGQQLLAGKFRRRVQVEGCRLTVGRQGFCSESMQMCLVAGRYLKGCRINLEEVAG